ncbi:MAG: metallophosphoesterase family protein [Caldilineaceae bacterium]|nr:metallophosphoesterase family protein [Caldilineaceae bacterium]
MRIAILADIHSNLPALEAVRADLRLVAPDRVFLAGDQVNRCPWPNEVMALIEDEGWPAIRGNHEVILASLDTPDGHPLFNDRQRFADLWWTLEELTPEHLAQVRALPAEQLISSEDGPPIRLLHGLRDNPFEGLSPELSDEQIGAKVADIEEPVVVSAHTHWPLARAVAGKQVFNPGSVGMPYNGDPRAQYMLLDGAGGSWQPVFRQVAYDRGLVREAFDRLGLFEAYGPLGPLYWQTIATGDPWVSDFQVWLRDQPGSYTADLAHAVNLYLDVHGPGRWAFSPM